MEANYHISISFDEEHMDNMDLVVFERKQNGDPRIVNVVHNIDTAIDIIELVTGRPFNPDAEPWDGRDNKRRRR